MKLFAQCDKDGAVAQAGQGEGSVWVLPPGWTEVRIAGADFQLCTVCTAAWIDAATAFIAQIPKTQALPLTPAADAVASPATPATVTL